MKAETKGQRDRHAGKQACRRDLLLCSTAPLLPTAYSLLLTVFCLLSAASWAEDREAELKRVQKELEIRKKEAKSLEQKEKGVLEELRQIDRSIEQAKRKIEKLRTKEQVFKDLLETLNMRREELTSEIARQESLIDEKLVLIYEYEILNGLPQIDPIREHTIFYIEEVLKEDSTRHNELLKLSTNITTKEEEEREGLRKIKEIKSKAEEEQRQIFSEQRKKRHLLKTVRGEKEKKEALVRELEKSRTELEALLAEVKKYPAKELDTLIWPARGKVVSRFGTVVDPELGTRLVNKGIDIRAPYGTDVMAVQDGVVVYEGTFLGYGQVVLIDHQNGFCSLYAHLSETLVVQGDKVKKGEVLGRVGNSGLVESPTLHFELRKDGVAVDPMNYLK